MERNGLFLGMREQMSNYAPTLRLLLHLLRTSWEGDGKTREKPWPTEQYGVG